MEQFCENAKIKCLQITKCSIEFPSNYYYLLLFDFIGKLWSRELANTRWHKVDKSFKHETNFYLQIKTQFTQKLYKEIDRNWIDGGYTLYKICETTFVVWIKIIQIMLSNSNIFFVCSPYSDWFVNTTVITMYIRWTNRLFTQYQVLCILWGGR